MISDDSASAATFGFCPVSAEEHGGAFAIGPVHVTQGLIIATFVSIAVLAIIWYRIRTRDNKYKGDQ